MVIIIALFQAALIGMETIMPLCIQGVLEHTATVSGIAMLPGAVIGARLVTKVPERTLRLLFGCFLIVAAVMLVLNEVGIFG